MNDLIPPTRRPRLELRPASTRTLACCALLIPILLMTWPPAARADIEAGRKRATEVCGACHGADGNSASGQFPILAGQTARYIFIQLRDFKEGRRSDPVMSPFAAALDRQAMLDVGEYFEAQNHRQIPFKADPVRVERGRLKSEETLCTMCHLGGFKGQNEVPRVAGQYPEYIQKQLEAFKARTRTNDAGNMTAVAQTLSDDSIIDLAHFLADLR
jgi:cytochrome c553